MSIIQTPIDRQSWMDDVWIDQQIQNLETMIEDAERSLDEIEDENALSSTDKKRLKEQFKTVIKESRSGLKQYNALSRQPLPEDEF
jgi:Mg2+ and Co2+ transporter CorA